MRTKCAQAALVAITDTERGFASLTEPGKVHEVDLSYPGETPLYKEVTFTQVTAQDGFPSFNAHFRVGGPDEAWDIYRRYVSQSPSPLQHEITDFRDQAAFAVSKKRDGYFISSRPVDIGVRDGTLTLNWHHGGDSLNELARAYLWLLSEHSLRAKGAAPLSAEVRQALRLKLAPINAVVGRPGMTNSALDALNFKTNFKRFGSVQKEGGARSTSIIGRSGGGKSALVDQVISDWLVRSGGGQVLEVMATEWNRTASALESIKKSALNSLALSESERASIAAAQSMESLLSAIPNSGAHSVYLVVQDAGHLLGSGLESLHTVLLRGAGPRRLEVYTATPRRSVTEIRGAILGRSPDHPIVEIRPEALNEYRETFRTWADTQQITMAEGTIEKLWESSGGWPYETRLILGELPQGTRSITPSGILPAVQAARERYAGVAGVSFPVGHDTR